MHAPCVAACSASELASKELPGLDVSVRGAVSLARRLQDPLAELVKVEPQHLGEPFRAFPSPFEPFGAF